MCDAMTWRPPPPPRVSCAPHEPYDPCDRVNTSTHAHHCQCNNLCLHTCEQAQPNTTCCIQLLPAKAAAQQQSLRVLLTAARTVQQTRTEHSIEPNTYATSGCGSSSRAGSGSHSSSQGRCVQVQALGCVLAQHLHSWHAQQHALTLASQLCNFCAGGGLLRITHGMHATRWQSCKWDVRHRFTETRTPAPAAHPVTAMPRSDDQRTCGCMCT
jgi:hypothetical protein